MGRGFFRGIAARGLDRTACHGHIEAFSMIARSCGPGPGRKDRHFDRSSDIGRASVTGI
jgi:hypothetical protein